MKCHATCKCALCGELMDYLGPLDLADVNVIEVANSIAGKDRGIMEHITHKCKDRSTGIAYFAGFKRGDSMKFSSQEIEDAKVLSRIFGPDGFTHVCREVDGEASLTDGDRRGGAIGWFSVGIERDAFPSVKPGQTMTLDEIVGAEE